MTGPQVRRKVDSVLEVDPQVDHVDIVAVSVRDSVQRLVARITFESGSFAVHAHGDLEKRILRRLEHSSVSPRTLDELGHVFDAPELLASPVHTMADCIFDGCAEAPLEELEPELTLI